LNLGVAVASAAPSVGGRVPHAEADVGAIATQANTNVFYGVNGLKLLKKGFPPQTALEAMLKEDKERETRQVIIIDKNGRIAAFTGKKTIEWKGHLVGKGYAVAGNLLVGKRVIEAMAQTFESFKGELAERLLATSEAGQNAGGDKRGKTSAALLVVGKEFGGRDRLFLYVLTSTKSLWKSLEGFLSSIKNITSQLAQIEITQDRLIQVVLDGEERKI
jgi:uncharacterized Ntn-hydrolase superfamily protein